MEEILRNCCVRIDGKPVKERIKLEPTLLWLDSMKQTVYRVLLPAWDCSEFSPVAALIERKTVQTEKRVMMLQPKTARSDHRALTLLLSRPQPVKNINV